MGFILISLIAPASMMAALLFGFRKAIILKNNRTVQIVLLVIAIGLGTAALVAPESLNVIWFVTPSLLVMVAIMFTRMALLGWSRESWQYAGISLILILLTCGILFNASRIGGPDSIVGFLGGIPAASAALGAAIWMAVTLPRWRKMIAVVYGILLPLAFYASIMVGL